MTVNREHLWNGKNSQQHINKRGFSIQGHQSLALRASLVLITLYKHLRQQTECINQDSGLYTACMSCNRNTPVCLHQKWTETGRRDCFDCCPEQQNCSITPPSTFIMLFPGISCTQSELNLSWPVAVSQTSTDSHACIELLWETQRGSGGLVARETPMNFQEMTHRALFSPNILFVPHNTMLFFFFCSLSFFWYWFIPREKKGVLTWTWLKIVDLTNECWLFILHCKNHS